MASTIRAGNANSVGVIWDSKTGESILCHSCRKDENRAKIAASMDELFPLNINPKRTCARCHDQQGVWWFMRLGRERKKESE